MLKKLSFTIFSLILFLVLIFILLRWQGGGKAYSTHQRQDGKIHWRMALTWGKGMPIFEAAALRFAENVKKMTDGRMVIEVDPANKHKSPFGVFDFVRSGQYEMAHTASYYWKGKDPATPVLTTTPFGMNAHEQYAWYYYGGGLQLMQKVYAKHGLYSFPAGNTGVQMGGWFKNEIKSLEDMKGLKMRIPGLAGDVMAKIGVKPVNIAAGELYTALQLGTIDALEWVNPHIDINMGFHQISNHYYTGWHEPSAELQFLINQKAFDQLPQDIQWILKIAMRESGYDMWIQGMYENAHTWTKMKEKHPEIQVHQFPEEVLQEMKTQTDVVLEELSQESKEAKEIIQSQKAFLKKARQWTDVSEKAYLEIR